jgi:uncharacterized protein (TIGR02246 family)
MTVEDVVLRFVEAINRADVGQLVALITDDHAFVDSDGSKITGREAVREAWSGYFSMTSDYTVAVEQALCSGNTVVVVGTASGAFARGGSPRPGSRWSVPAAWRAVVEGERVAVWQVFVNPEPIRAALDSASGTA